MNLYRQIKINNRTIDIYSQKLSTVYYDGSRFTMLYFKDLDNELELLKNDPIQNLSKNRICNNELKLMLKFKGFPVKFSIKEQAILQKLGYASNQYL